MSTLHVAAILVAVLTCGVGFLVGLLVGVRACTRSLNQQMDSIDLARRRAAYRALFDEEMP